MSRRVLVVVLAFALDAALGDPQNPYHPIRLIGSMITGGVKRFRQAEAVGTVRAFIWGMALSIAVIACTFTAVWGILALCDSVHTVLGIAVEVALCYFVVAAKALKAESMRVHAALVSGDIHEARARLSYIVGRDTQELNASEIAQAAVETVAENLSDGVIAPLLYVLVGGVSLGFVYKAVNTLDSMIGYRNDTFRSFGKFAARLDDGINWIPARLSALLMIAATLLTGDDFRGAARIYLRDRRKHNSPNSAQTEAVCAGALGLQLGGAHAYGGVTVPKPTIGDPVHPVEAKHIVGANRLMYTAASLLVASMAAGAAFWRILHG